MRKQGRSAGEATKRETRVLRRRTVYEKKRKGTKGRESSRGEKMLKPLAVPQTQNQGGKEWGKFLRY